MAKKRKKKPGGGPQAPNEQCESPDYSDAKQLEAMIRKNFAFTKERLRHMEPSHPNVTARTDFDSNRIKRRIKAAAAYASRVREQVQDICPDIPDLFSIEEEWAHINSLPVTSYDTQEGEMYLVLAAAIWMLDHIKQNGKIREAIDILPNGEDILEEVYIPNIYDSVHQYEVIASMVYAIEHRNDDCVLPGQTRARRRGKAEDKLARCFTDFFTTADTHRQDVPSRQRFEALLQMIRREDIEQAVSGFEAAIFDWTRRYFRCRAVYCEKEKELSERRDQFIESMEETMKGFMFGPSRKPQDFPFAKKEPPRLPEPMSAPKTGLDKFLPDSSRLMDFRDRIERFEEESHELDTEANKLAFVSRRLCTDPYAKVERDYGAEVADAISGFSVADPYAMCFALLYLLDSGSDLPWLYYPGTVVVECAGAMLPWYGPEYDELDDEHWAQYYDPEEYVKSRPEKNPPELADWYRLDYRNNTSDIDFQTRVNLAQIVYEATGGIMPRDLHRYDDKLKLLRHYGVTGKKTQIPLLYCMTLLGEGMFRSESRIIPYEPPEETDEESQAGDTDTERIDSGQSEQLAALKREIDRLKRAAYEAERESRELRKQHDALLQRTQREHQELSELREILFNRENELEAEFSEETSDIALPYTVRRTTVVFGGHDTWSKAIRPLLAGDIRFVDRGMRPDADLIRHAGVVWIQPNSLSHANYYKIINTIRTHRIPLHYFKFVSAEKCAAQLALEDQKLP